MEDDQLICKDLQSACHLAMLSESAKAEIPDLCSKIDDNSNSYTALARCPGLVSLDLDDLTKTSRNQTQALISSGSVPHLH